MTVPAIQDLIKKSFAKSMYDTQVAGSVRQLFQKDTQDFTQNLKRVQEVDRERFAEQKVEGMPSAQRGIGQGYFKDISRKTISITRKVSGEAYQALEAQKLSQWAMDVAQDVTDKIELDMRNYLGYATIGSSYVDNGGFTIDLTTGDGLSFFNTAHTLKFSATTYSNILSGAPVLSNVALESAEDYFSYNVLDNYGQRLAMKPNTLITTRKAIMVNRVARILNSQSPEAIAGTLNANAGVANTYKNKYTHLVVEFDVDAFNITKSSLTFYWALACLGGAPEDSLQLWYISWQSPMVATPEVKQDEWYMSFTARALYGIGSPSARGIIISEATS